PDEGDSDSRCHRRGTSASLDRTRKAGADCVFVKPAAIDRVASEVHRLLADEIPFAFHNNLAATHHHRRWAAHRATVRSRKSAATLAV
ncbi:MAG: hypothetical protein ACRD3J_13330, partial [Thermoanaerobaculia bacterium]